MHKNLTDTSKASFDLDGEAPAPALGDPPKPIFKAVYFAIKCVYCLGLCFSLRQELLELGDVQHARTHSFAAQQHAVRSPAVIAAFLTLHVLTAALTVPLVLLTLSKPRWYRSYWQLFESLFHVLALQLIAMVHCVARPLYADVPTSMSVISSVLPFFGHGLEMNLATNLMMLPLWFATDCYVRSQLRTAMVGVGGCHTFSPTSSVVSGSSSGGGSCSAVTGGSPSAGLSVAVVQDAILRLSLLLVCQCCVAIAVHVGSGVKGMHDVQQQVAVAPEDEQTGAVAPRGGVLRQALRWVKSRQGRLLIGPVVYVASALFVVYSFLPLLPAMNTYGPLSIAHGAGTSPAQVYGLCLALWLMSRSEFASDWGQLSDSMGRRLKDQQRKHRQLLVINALQKDRVEKAVQQLQMEKAQLCSLQDEHQRLLHHQQVLQAELQVALKAYVPSTIIDAGTPADRMLGMCAEWLEGGTPSLDNILYVQNALLSVRDVYRPMDLRKQMQSSHLDEDISSMLVQQLVHDDAHVADSAHDVHDVSEDRPAHEGGEGDENGVLSDTPSSSYGGLTSPTGPEQRAGHRGGGSFPDVPPTPGLPQPQRRARRRDFGYDADGLEVALRTILECPSQEGSLTGEGKCMEGKPSQGNLAKGGDGELSMSRATSAALSPAGALHQAVVRRSATHGSLSIAPPSPTLEGHNNAADDDGQGSKQRQQQQQQQQLLQSVPPPILEEVERLLPTADTWVFDAFSLCAATHGHPLSTLAYYVMHTSGLMSHFKLSGTMVARFFRRIESGYRDHPYHSQTHASNVLQMMHVLMHRGGLIPLYCDPLTLLACYIAAAVHDFEHKGVTNDFLVASVDELALRYNDRSPQENHHLAATFSVLREPEHNFLSRLPKADFDRLRKMVIDLVLATDMKQHFAFTSQFNTVHRLSATSTSSTRTSERCSPSNSFRQMRQNSGRGDNAGGAALANGSALGNGSGNLRSPQTSSGQLALESPKGSAGIGDHGLCSGAGSMSEGGTSRDQGGAGGVGADNRGPDRVRAAAGSGGSMSLMGSGGAAASAAVAALRSRVSSMRAMTHPSDELLSEGRSETSASLVAPNQPLDENERMLSLQVALKCADLGHMATPDLGVHVKWVQSLEEEMFRQGDQEKALRLTVSPLFDRDKPGVTKCQIGFYEIVVIPLFKSYVQVFTQAKPLLAHAMRDYQHWASLPTSTPPTS